jgi:ABC-type Fe3+-siderophore transport system permease subunit
MSPWKWLVAGLGIALMLLLGYTFSFGAAMWCSEATDGCFPSSWNALLVFAAGGAVAGIVAIVVVCRRRDLRSTVRVVLLVVIGYYVLFSVLAALLGPPDDGQRGMRPTGESFLVSLSVPYF